VKTIFCIVPVWGYVEKTYCHFQTGFNPVFLLTMVVGGFGSLPLPEAWRHPNQAHERHGHTMGDAASAWFGYIPLWARAVNASPTLHFFVTLARFSKYEWLTSN
jgi:hypothetical protein